MAIYLTYGEIVGNVTAEGFVDHIKVEACNFGIARGIDMEAGNMSNREACRPVLSEFNFTHKADNSVTEFFNESVTGSKGTTAVFKFVQTGTDAVEEFMSYELLDCLVSGYSISADATGDPIENISLSYSQINVNYYDFDKTNKGASPKRRGYDLTTAKPL
ncbi:MAG: type VI secretion system secreted protein Hcp [Lentisphaeria bacterium]|jgi:type VI secretion system secreted protein Hcp